MNFLLHDFWKEILLTVLSLKMKHPGFRTYCFLILLLLCGMSGLYAQKPSDKNTQQVSTEVPRHIERKFRRDAARLALRLEAEKDEYRFLNVKIPKANTDEIYRALINVYKNSPTAQSLANCNVHTFPNPSIESFTVIFDKNISWARPLRQGINETLNPKINQLLQTHQLIIDKYVQWNERQDAITIRTREPLNVAAAANEFFNIEGVESVDFGVPKIGGNDILLRRINDGWELEYVLVFGEYISNNGKSHRWIFRAMDDGAVKFVKESGDPVPDWMRCALEKNTPLATF